VEEPVPETDARLGRRALHAFPPARPYVAVAFACLVGAIVVLPLSRPPAPGPLTACALVLDAVICLLVAWSHRLPDSDRIRLVRAIATFVVGLLAGVPAWFFGTFSGFAGVVTLGAMLVGILSVPTKGRWSTLGQWSTYVGLALGQALAFALPFFGVIGDHSLLPVFFYFEHRNPGQVTSHLAMQAVYFAAFAGARAFQRKYHRLALEVDEAVRSAAVRSALVEEARAEYMRALIAGRRAAGSHPPVLRRPLAETTDTVPSFAASMSLETRPLSGEDAALAVAASDSAPTVPDSGPMRFSSDRALEELVVPASVATPAEGKEADLPWGQAYRTKMQSQHFAVMALAVFGTFVAVKIAHHRVQVYVIWLSIVLVVLVTWLHRYLVRVRKRDSLYWPWALIAIIGAGPSYAFGLHSNFAAVIVALLFLGGLFRAKQRAKAADRRIVVLAALSGAQVVTFLLIDWGVVPDFGNVPVFMKGVPRFEAIANQVLLQGIYVSAFVAGWLVDRRYEALMRRASNVAREETKQIAALAATRAAIEALQAEEGEGIFADHRVGRFHLRHLHARGGMGDVYEADEIGTDRRVAVKLVRYERAADPVMLELFVREASALKRVQSPHVAEVLDAGGLEEELPYVAMEFIDGPPLSAVLRDQSRLTLAELRALIGDACRGLAAIHRAGIVHRDVKPQNIMRATADAAAPWKLVDLGVAQALDPSLTAQHLLMGTPQYMAPEQVRNATVDARADLYSLCLVVYRALTGRPALLGRNRLATRSSRDDTPPNPRWFVALPTTLEYALRIGLATRPEDRFASAEELAAAFEAAFAGTFSHQYERRALGLLEREPWSSPSEVTPEPRTT
jgi:Protein kinase domain